MNEFLAAMVGHQIRGGCDDCGAYQTVTRDEFGIWHMTVHHDETCPWLSRHGGGGR